MNGAPDGQLRSWLIRYRAWVSAAAHLVLFSLSLLLAFLLRFEFRFTSTDPDYSWLAYQYLPYLPVTLVIKLFVFGWMGLHRDSWRYVGLRDLFSIAKATHISVFLCLAIIFGAQWAGVVDVLWLRHVPAEVGNLVPKSIYLLDWVLTIALVSAARVGLRFYHEELRPLGTGARIRLLIVGAEDVGEAILREIIRASEDRYHVVGFLDDDWSTQRARIRGIDVLGTTEDIRRVCKERDVDEVLIAMPMAPQRHIRHLIELCEGVNLRFRTVPAITDVIEGRVQVSQIRPVDIEDLLGREAVTLDTEAVGQYIRDKVVMVTGAGGSIGSEMCRQIAPFRPRTLLLVERMENALFEIDRQLRKQFPELVCIPHVADIGDAGRIGEILRGDRPSVVFHAAAHKHVPMMELNPGESIKNNIVGTRVLADAASASDVEKFVMISTDKAVNPTSVMGCTKRVAEMYVQQLGSHTRSRTEFVTVRFGNVLGSSGSVVPIFKEQIARGGPVTVTHPEMRRYFMTIPEASQLVLQAGAMGHGGEIFLLDMGEPVKIVQLAVDLITLSGLRPHEDIEISFVGIRPGEKLFEELSITGEDVIRTGHPKIGIMMKRPEDFDRLGAGIERLVAMMDSAGAEEIRAELQSIVPEYTPSVPDLAEVPHCAGPEPREDRAPAGFPAAARVRPA